MTLEDDIGTVEVDGEVVLRVDAPELWWPNGMGEQHLYDVEAGGVRFAVGFREVSFDDYELRVNGVAVPVKGWNWVPIDALYGVPRPEKLAHLLGLAARANVNLIRVWGGGLIETPEFYDLCDRLGLLVWQEFAQSSSGIDSKPSDDPDFVATMAEDARQIVPRRRARPSLAIWCGGNELDGDDSTPVLAALEQVVQELDPERHWLPTSPLGEADVHGPWEHQGLRAHNEHYDTRTSRLHSEFGVEGMTNRRALEALIAEEHRWPADRSNPGLRASRRLVEQRAARAGGVRRPDPGRRDDAPLLAVAAVRGAPVCGRGDAAAGSRDDPVAAERAVPERMVHLRGRPSG